MSFWIIVIITLIYLAILFGIAYFFEELAKRGKHIINSAFIYAISLTVYCTAWTYYGSVGNAVTDGISFLSIYLGPTLSMPLWWIIVRKMIRICHNLRVSTLADFFAARFEQSWLVSVLVTIICLAGIIPYISIQLKSIVGSINILSDQDILIADNSFFLNDTAFYLSIILAFFIIVFAFRHIDSMEKHNGLIGAIAFESIFKLVAFLLVGVFATYVAFDGFGDLFSKAQNVEKYAVEFSAEWPFMIFLSMNAIILLPRQFHVAVAENHDETHLKQASWLFPIYLLAINLFVIPIAIAGELSLDGSIDPDTYVLALPLFFDQQILAVVSYIGGFSAAIGMMLISTIALSTMLSQNVVIPLFIRKSDSAISLKQTMYIKRVSVFAILLLAYLFYKIVAEQFSIVSIGLISFAAVSQFSPALFGTLYWSDFNKNAIVGGLVVGFLIWGYTLVIPTLIQVGLISQSLIVDGPFGIGWLNPYALFGSDIENHIVHGTLWSMLFNISTILVMVVFGQQSDKERFLADYYLNPFTYGTKYSERLVWKGTVVYQDLISVSNKLLGQQRVSQAVNFYHTHYEAPLKKSGEVNSQFINYMERLLSGAIGSTSARMLIASIAKSELIVLDDLVEILKQKRETAMLNEKLKAKSKELELKSTQLEIANNRLKNLDQEKDEFISTVNHELRTPLTTIKALCEIIYDHDDMEDEERKSFLETVINESERMTRLINQVLDLEKLESGKVLLQMETISYAKFLDQVLFPYEKQCEEKGIKFFKNFTKDEIIIYVDKDKLTEVIVNLVSNAINHTDNGYIEVSVRLEKNQVITSVKDTGKGILPAYLDQIFDKFFQIKKNENQKPSGSGLGLSITKKQVMLHGGKIWANSQIDQGSVFSFSLPSTKTSDE